MKHKTNKKFNSIQKSNQIKQINISCFLQNLSNQNKCSILELNDKLPPSFTYLCHTPCYNVIQLYIRVFVVLSKSLSRKEREKLDINLDSAVFVCRVKEI
jgi:hypothetical protein